MPDNQYPVFESGQTLTAPDLNTLRSFLHERDRLVGRMIGFGINAGLAGSVTGTTLTIPKCGRYIECSFHSFIH